MTMHNKSAFFFSCQIDKLGHKLTMQPFLGACALVLDILALDILDLDILGPGRPTLFVCVHELRVIKKIFFFKSGKY